MGCDFEIDSGALEDRCGVCHGDGSTCHTVRETFREADDDKGMGQDPWWGDHWPFLMSPPRLERGSREAAILGPGSKQESGHLALETGLSSPGVFLPQGAQAGPIRFRGPSVPPPYLRVFCIHYLSANYVSKGGTGGDVLTDRGTESQMPWREGQRSVRAPGKKSLTSRDQGRLPVGGGS